MLFGLQSMYYKYIRGVNPWDQTARETSVKRMELVCCRGDSASLQVVAGAEEDFLLTVGTETLFWKGGPLPVVRIQVELDEAAKALQPEVRLIGLVRDDDGGRKSDVLLDQSSIHVAARNLQQVFVEIHVGAQAQPGRYSGVIRLFRHTMFEDEVPVGELSFGLTVLQRRLPAPEQYRFYLDLWQHNANIARKYDVRLWSDAHFAIIERYLESLGNLGQKAASLVVSEIPWSGQGSHMDDDPSDLFEYNIVSVIRRADGTFSYDYRAMDRYIELAERYGIKEEIELFGLLNVWETQDGVYGSPVSDYPDGIRLRYFDERTGTFRFMRKRGELEHYIRALEEHLRSLRVCERVRVMADEPADLALFNERLQALRQAAPSFKLKVAINHSEFISAKLDGIRDYVPKLTCAFEEFNELRRRKPDIGGKLLYYVCNNPRRPNTLIGSPALESRIIPWLAARLELDGFLRWNYTVWPDRPLESIQYRPQFWPAGDTNFVYPGKDGGPMLSLRYKWLQRGIRDYELMRQMRAEGLGEAVDRLLDGVFRFTDEELGTRSLNEPAEALYSLDPTEYDRLFALLQAAEEGGE
ncbi:DUF4091 domain-containing protein [Paenibacillus faecis]|uniref:DUF4091 domain-containing protein n=1 Tax=Paenibacillus faecis TaxID=862114 RepID=A0A5D0CXL4_9BACL|nr:DUF4091 domain-containing protein [Paenibacillus faecis]TYA14721.1 DUF4091 domain-containing protein [Paenibacillus faecis]